MDLFILPMQGDDMVLGIQWLELLCPLVTNYKLMAMDFQWYGKEVHLTGEPQISEEFLLDKQLIKITKSQSIISLYHRKAILPENTKQMIYQLVSNLRCRNMLTFLKHLPLYLHLKILTIKFTLKQMLHLMSDHIDAPIFKN